MCTIKKSLSVDISSYLIFYRAEGAFRKIGHRTVVGFWAVTRYNYLSLDIDKVAYEDGYLRSRLRGGIYKINTSGFLLRGS